MDECAEIIVQIKLLHDELRRLEVKPELINFRKLSPEQLLGELDSVAEQVKRRKIFLGVN